MRRSRFGFGSRGSHDAWFRIGNLDVTTSWLVVLLSVVGFVAFAVGGLALELRIMLIEDQVVTQGKVWQLLTWPFAHLERSVFWDAVSVFFLYWFGQDIERSVGKVKYLWFLVLSTVGLGLLMTIMYLVAPFTSAYLASISLLQMMVLLVWIAEGPTRMFMFNIPAWVFGLIIIGLQVVQMMGYRLWGQLLHFFLGMVLVAVIAKSLGMLTEVSWIPRIGGSRRPRLRSVPTGPASVHPLQPRESKWNPAPSIPVGRDEARMNELLDKILESGQASLTPAELDELEELRMRRKRG